jgi:hypothetical protein
MKRIAVLIGGFLFVSTIALAHGGKEHVVGTVSKVSESSITVKTTANAEVVVNVAAHTTFSKNSAAASLKDVKIGDRVVIHAHKAGQALEAETVEIGVSKPAPKPH